MADSDLHRCVWHSASFRGLCSAMHSVKLFGCVSEPGSPESVQGVTLSTDQIVVSWLPVYNATTVTVLVAVTGEAVSLNISGIQSDMHNITIDGLNEGQNYTIEVYSVKFGVRSERVVITQVTSESWYISF